MTDAVVVFFPSSVTLPQKSLSWRYTLLFYITIYATKRKKCRADISSFAPYYI
jgi:hypothetical protein